MKEPYHDLDKEIDTGIARAEKMLRRRKIFASISALTLLGVSIFIGILSYPTYQRMAAERSATLRALQTSQAKASQTAEVARSTQSARTTATAQIQTATAIQAEHNTATAQVKISATQAAQMTVTSVAQEKATEQAILASTQKAQASATAMVRDVRSMVDKTVLLWGPVDGELEHHEDDYVSTFYSDIEAENFVIAAKFTNPYSPSVGSWDYGFFFRHTGGNQQYRLTIFSDKKWVLTLSDGEERNNIASGNIENLNTSNNTSNTVELIVQGRAAYLFVNDVFISELDLSEKVEPGSILIATGIYNGDEINGKTTKFDDFSVRVFSSDKTLEDPMITKVEKSDGVYLHIVSVSRNSDYELGPLPKGSIYIEPSKKQFFVYADNAGKLYGVRIGDKKISVIGDVQDLGIYIQKVSVTCYSVYVEDSFDADVHRRFSLDRNYWCP